MRHWLLGCLLAVMSTAAPMLSPRTPSLFLSTDGTLPGGNGSARLPYRKLQDAIATGERVVSVQDHQSRAGEYVLRAPLLVERPVDLRVSTELIEDLDGWPTGDVEVALRRRSSPTMAPDSAALCRWPK
jgi:hypothetical protein